MADFTSESVADMKSECLADLRRNTWGFNQIARLDKASGRMRDVVEAGLNEAAVSPVIYGR